MSRTRNTQYTVQAQLSLLTLVSSLSSSLRSSALICLLMVAVIPVTIALCTSDIACKNISSLLLFMQTTTIVSCFSRGWFSGSIMLHKALNTVFDVIHSEKTFHFILTSKWFSWAPTDSLLISLLRIIRIIEPIDLRHSLFTHLKFGFLVSGSRSPEPEPEESELGPTFLESMIRLL